MLIPFPGIKDANLLKEQIVFVTELQNSLQRASCSIGILISIAQKLMNDITTIIKQAKKIMGSKIHHRVLLK